MGETPEGLRFNVMEALSRGDLRGAIAYLERVMAGTGDVLVKGLAHAFHAELLLRCGGDPERVSADLSIAYECLADSPIDLTAVLLSAALLHSNRGDLTKLEMIVSRAEDLVARHPEASICLGRLYQFRGRIFAAVGRYEEAEAAYDQGLACIEAYDEPYEQQQRRESVLVLAAWVQIRRGRLTEAAASLEGACGSLATPATAACYRAARAELCTAEGDYSAAEQLLAIEFPAGEAAIYGELARAELAATRANQAACDEHRTEVKRLARQLLMEWAIAAAGRAGEIAAKGGRVR